MEYGFDPEQPGAVRLREDVRSLLDDLAPVTVEVRRPIGLPDGRRPDVGERVSVPARLARWLVETGRARL